MYKKAMSLMVLASFVVFACLLCVESIDNVRLKALTQENLWENILAEAAMPEESRETRILGIAETAVSGPRILVCDVIQNPHIYDFTNEELEVLLRIVEAEAGGEDADGKLLVANVVLNRLKSDKFPDTIPEVVFQKDNGVIQFSPVSNGSFYKVIVSEETVEAVDRALCGEDISQGALYFAARKYADSGKMKWFDEKLQFLFLHGGHEFFR